jgi:thiopeptide-type bacteriocin biosynthesis protein
VTAPKDPPRFADAGGWVLRSPLLPMQALVGLSDGVDPDDPVAAFAEIEARLRELVRDPVVREALFLASPSLEERIDRWLAGEDPEGGRTTRSVLSYVTRMATRCTPFGLFAGCAVGELGDGRTVVELAGPERAVRHTRLDFEYLVRLVADLHAGEQTRAALRFVPNTSLYPAGARLRMAEATYEGEILRYHRVAIEEDEFLRATLERAGGGAGLEELARALVDDEITLEEALEYVAELVESQVLVPDLGPPVTGPEPTRSLVDTLLASPGTKTVGEHLDRAQEKIEGLDRAGLGRPPAAFRAIADDLAGAGTEVRIARLFQADLHLGVECAVIGPDVRGALDRAIEALHRLAHRPRETELDRFLRAYQERYEGAETSLLEVLDEEIGVGFGSSGAAIDGRPLLAGPVAPAAGAEGPRRTAYDDALLALYVDHVRRGGGALVLDDAALDKLAAPDPPALADAFAVHATLLAGDDGGPLRVAFHSATGPSGARLLGRFCHGDAALDALVRRHLEQEEALAPDARFFEVVHLPEGRVGNVLCRPALRDLEVAYLGRSGADPAQVLPATDLLVSVQANRLVLRSASLGCELVPRLSTAHNYPGSRIALYRFLGALQGHRLIDGLIWSWGGLSGLPELPRVELADGTILSRAMWLLSGDDLRPVVKAGSPAAAWSALQAVREARRLPRFVAVAMADNELVLDLDSVGSAVLVAHEARAGNALPLIEVLSTPDALVVTSPAGRHANEILVPLVKVVEPRRAEAATPVSSAPVARVFTAGSEWLSCKLYCGAGTADGLIRDVVRPLAAEVLGAGLADRWFFLRYGDPGWHVRVRFHGDPTVLAAQVLPRLQAACAPFVDDGRISAVVVDTYRREVERYGGPLGVELFELWSSIDSTAVADLVALLAGDDGLDIRWRAAVAGADGQLAALGFDVPTRQRLVRSWRDGLVAEHGATGTNLLRHAGGVHRKEKDALARLLVAPEDDLDPPLVIVRRVLARRNESLAVIGLQLREGEADGRLAGSIESIAGSFTHLHVNRLLRGAPRAQELVIYDLLDRWYRNPRSRSGPST